MGPQPWELRKPDTGAHTISGQSGLQWGRSLGSCGNSSGTRAVATASTASMGPQPCGLLEPVASLLRQWHRTYFNGAAALGAAETTVLVAIYLRGMNTLQWGRSLGSCGNSLQDSGKALDVTASMGPQPWELRKP